MRLGRRPLLGGALGLVACRRSGGPGVPGEPRLVTVGGAVTEIVFALGAGDLVVGVDTSSLYPEVATRRPQVGYQRALAAEGVLGLRPTLVLATAEAGPPAALEQIRSAGVTVQSIAAEPSVEGARDRIRAVAQALGRAGDAAPLLARLDRELAAVRPLTAGPRVLPIYARGGAVAVVSGRGTAADAMLGLVGARNAAGGLEGSRPLTAEAAVAAAPDVILVPSHGLDSVGGIDGLLRLPGLGETPAGKARRVVALDDLLLLGFGPRTGQAAGELVRKIRTAMDGA